MKVDEIPPGTREGIWCDNEGDYWKFIGETWHYQKGTYENDWEDTESDFEPEPRYGPFERVGCMCPDGAVHGEPYPYPLTGWPGHACDTCGRIECECSGTRAT